MRGVRRRTRSGGRRVAGPVRAGPVLVLMSSLAVVVAAHPSGAATTVTPGPLVNVSAPCTGGNAEVAQAVDPAQPGVVYEAWTGCAGIGYARSVNGGASFSPAVTLSGSDGSPGDPAMAVAPDGTLYIAYMVYRGDQNYPVVDASFDHGVTFPQITALTPPGPDNWGDSPNIAVAPDGTVYVTWDYGPRATGVVLHCNPAGSCAYVKGDLNVVIQSSTDEGATFGALVPVNPGFPDGGADNGPVVADSSGRVDVLYQDYPTNPVTQAMSPAINYFTSSTDGGATWSTPVAVGASAGKMSRVEWWNEPSLGIDASGDLYAAWDTQKTTITQNSEGTTSSSTDTGWLSYSTDGGATWSAPVQGPADREKVPHIMEVVGTGPGQADVAWLSDSNPLGYTLYLRPFTVAGGWQSAPVPLSTSYGNPRDWPGDTFGLDAPAPGQVITSWGFGLPGPSKTSVVYAAAVTLSS